MPPLVIVPGLRPLREDDWLSFVAREHPGSVTLGRMDDLSCRGWIASLDAAVASLAEPPLIVAYCAGVLAVAHWAKRRSHPVHGALLVTPLDFESPLPEGYPPYEPLHRHGWLPMPLAGLPFPSLVAASTNDPSARYTRTLGLARVWGSRIVRIGNVGHLDAASGYGRWPQANEMIAEAAKLARERV